MFEQCVKAKKIMDKFGFSWFIAGGWAIDLFLGRETREHDDIEIGIYRKNQMKLYRYFEKDKKYFIDNTSRIGKRVKREWKKEYLRLPIHELYVEREGLELEVLLNEQVEDQWAYRRNQKITLEASKVILRTGDRIPYLCPEIVLLYKSKEMREKDVADFRNVLPKMSEAQRAWLVASVGDAEAKEQILALF